MAKRDFLGTCLALAIGLPIFSAVAQEFPPKKTITMVVGFAAGGASDTGARLIARKLGENIGASVVIDNRPGAGGNIAHQFAATGPADGSVILLGSVGPLAIAPHLMKLPYDPEFAGSTPEEHLELFAEYAPEVSIDYFLVDRSVVRNEKALAQIARSLGGQVVAVDIRKAPGSIHHDVTQLALHLGHIMRQSLVG